MTVESREMGHRLIILSDIHANLSALNAVIADFESKNYKPSAIAILGDNINYGMRPNQVVKRLQELGMKYPVIVNLFGNHEKALLDGNTAKFSTERGKQILAFTREQLDDASFGYLNSLNSSGYAKVQLGACKVLFIHGSIDDPFWGKMNTETIHNPAYNEYDLVVSGHSHVPHLIERFVESDNARYRNKKRIVFLNPGSVGQPRNHSPKAQYLYVDLELEVFHFNGIVYDIVEEQSLYNNSVDPFYAERLTIGI